MTRIAMAQAHSQWRATMSNAEMERQAAEHDGEWERYADAVSRFVFAEAQAEIFAKKIHYGVMYAELGGQS